jgi:hypothetical protein
MPPFFTFRVGNTTLRGIDHRNPEIYMLIANVCQEITRARVSDNNMRLGEAKWHLVVPAVGFEVHPQLDSLLSLSISTGQA